MPNSDRKNIRRLFAAVVIFLPLQYGIVGLTGLVGWSEPWPAVVLPGFQSVWDRQEYVEVPQASLQVRFADDVPRIVPVASVFELMPASHHLGILRRQFTPSSMSGTTRTQQALDPGVRIWLRDRIMDLSGGGRAERLDVVWYQVRYGADGSFRSASPVDTLIIPFP